MVAKFEFPEDIASFKIGNTKRLGLGGKVNVMLKRKSIKSWEGVLKKMSH